MGAEGTTTSQAGARVMGASPPCAHGGASAGLDRREPRFSAALTRGSASHRVGQGENEKAALLLPWEGSSRLAAGGRPPVFSAGAAWSSNTTHSCLGSQICMDPLK